MYIFSAQLQAKPGLGGEVAAQLPALAAEISAAGGTQASAWAVASGGSIGEFAMSGRVENTAELLAMQQGLGASSKYQKAAAKVGGSLSGPALTNLVEIVMTSGEVGEAQPLVTVTRATIHAGALSAAMAWSAQIMEYVTKTTGTGGMLGTSAAGSMFQVFWMNGSADAAALDENAAKLAADPTYASMLEQAGDLFIPGSAERILLARMS